MFEVLSIDPDAGDPDSDEAALVAQITALETLKATAAAAQARATAALIESRRVTETARGVPARRPGRGLGSDVALARRDSSAPPVLPGRKPRRSVLESHTRAALCEHHPA